MCRVRTRSKREASSQNLTRKTSHMLNISYNFLNGFELISKMTCGTSQSAEIRRSAEKSHVCWLVVDWSLPWWWTDHYWLMVNWSLLWWWTDHHWLMVDWSLLTDGGLINSVMVDWSLLTDGELIITDWWWTDHYWLMVDWFITVPKMLQSLTENRPNFLFSPRDFIVHSPPPPPPTLPLME